MRIYQNAKQAMSEIQRDLFEMGTEVHLQSMQNKRIVNDPAFITKELQGYSFMILDTSDIDSIANNLPWCEAEFKERIAGWEDPELHTPLNPGEAWKLRDNVWNEFLVNGKFEYSYNERMYWQIKSTIEELKKNPGTRQAIIEVHSRKIDAERMGGKARIPCSMFYQFMLREGKLDVIYIMRSTDFFTHFKHDVWHANKIRDFIAEKIGAQKGKLIMFASSLHAYRKDFPEGTY